MEVDEDNGVLIFYAQCEKGGIELSILGITPDTCPVPECELANVAYRWKFFKENNISLEEYIRNRDRDDRLNDEVELVNLGTECLVKMEKGPDKREDELSIVTSKLHHLMKEIEEFNNKEKTIKNLLSAYKLIGENVKLIFPNSDWEKRSGFKDTIKDYEWIITPLIGEKVIDTPFIQTVDEGLNMISLELDKYLTEHPELMDVDERARELACEASVQVMSLLLAVGNIFAHVSNKMDGEMGTNVDDLKRDVDRYVPLCDMITRLLFILSPCEDTLADASLAIRDMLEERVKEFQKAFESGSKEDCFKAYRELVQLITAIKVLTLKLMEEVGGDYLHEVIPYALTSLVLHRISVYTDPEFWIQISPGETKEDAKKRVLDIVKTLVGEEEPVQNNPIVDFLEEKYQDAVEIIKSSKGNTFEDLHKFLKLTCELEDHAEKLVRAMDEDDDERLSDISLAVANIMIIQDYRLMFHTLFGKNSKITAKEMRAIYKRLDFNPRIMMTAMYERMKDTYPQMIEQIMKAFITYQD